MKRNLPVLLIAILLFAGAVFYFLSKETSSTNSSVVASLDEPVSRVSRVPDDVIIIEGAEEITADLHSREVEPNEDIEILQQLLFVYRQAYGANPQGGLNEEIVERLLGFNEKKVRFLPDTFEYLNKAGELVDRWGSPYFFHPVSSENMEIVSAGPDKELWTEDDVTIQ